MDPSLALAAALETAQVRSSDTRLENILLAEQLVDDAQTWRFLHHGYYEMDPLAKPFTHSPYTLLATSLLINGAVRLIPPGRTKTLLLQVSIGCEAANDVHNFFLRVKL